MQEKKGIAILGSTGSIGTQALEVLASYPDYFDLQVLTAGKNADLLIEQALKFQPNSVVITDQTQYQKVKDALWSAEIHVYAGQEALCQVVESTEVHTVLTALVGYAGLKPTIHAIEAGKTIALANKETLVVAGELITRMAREKGVNIYPVDSEHSAIFQCLVGEFHNPIEKIYLTASGGPFRGFSLEQLQKVTLEQALKHPNWSMGAKITIDSASLMNKGLEVIEAHHLFGVPAEQIKVLIHPQSVVHSMVRYIDGSVIAQLGQPDMKTPIAYGLGWPLRIDAGVKELDFTSAHDLSFEPVDLNRFPCLSLSYDALSSGGFAPTILNAANEIAVDSFLNNRIQFTQIAELVERVLNKTQVNGAMSLESILEADGLARQNAKAMVEGLNA